VGEQNKRYVIMQDHCGKYEPQTRVLRLKPKYAISEALQVFRASKDWWRSLSNLEKKIPRERNNFITQFKNSTDSCMWAGTAQSVQRLATG